MKIFTTLFNFIKETGHVLMAIVFLIPFVATMGEDNSADWEIYADESTTNPYITEYGDTDIAAHRGGAGLAPQNTMMAFENLMENREALGVDTYELDVQLTKDGKLVTIHDLNYDSTSDAAEFFGKENVAVSSLTYEEARQLNMGENFKLNGEKPYQGLRGDDIPDNLRIPLCEDVIKYVEENSGDRKFNYQIEVKSMGKNGRTATDELYKLIKKYGIEDRVIWATFDPYISSHMVKNYPEIPRSGNALEAVQFFFYARMDWDLSVANVTYSSLQLPFGSSAFDGLLNTGTRQILNYAHKNNISITYWTINNEDEIRYLANNGADCVITDQPGFVSEVINSMEF